MSARHVTLWVAGLDVTPDTLGALELTVGRTSPGDAPDAASLSVSVEWPAWAATPVIGDPVQVAGWLPGMEQTRVALFAGHVTDVALEGGVVSVLAVDPSRRLDGVKVGDQPWPMEEWPKRVERVLALARAALPSERWLRLGTLVPYQFQPLRVPWRDVDAQPILDLLAGLFEPLGGAWAYQCHQSFHGTLPHPADPGRWEPVMRQVNLIGLEPLVEVALPLSLVDGDAPPRTWMNLGAVCNRWTVTGAVVDAGGKPLEDGGQWEVVAALPDEARRRYGESSRTADTGLAWLPADANNPRPDWVAEELLHRTGYPTWAVDGLLVWLDGPALGEHPLDCEQVWTGLLARSPAGALGGRVVCDALPRPQAKWVVEGVRLVWLEDGWQVELLGLTDPDVYGGWAVHPPIDPRNPVSLAEPPPQVIGTGGVILQPLLHMDGQPGAAGGWWRVVAGGEDGPTVANTGAGCLVPTPRLPAGAHVLVVEWHRLLGYPSERLEVPVLVEARRTWRDAAGTTWAQAVGSWEGSL